eukprot:scaffold113031_cov46-Phaeocystis_antarctica.AAC.3
MDRSEHKHRTRTLNAHRRAASLSAAQQARVHHECMQLRPVMRVQKGEPLLLLDHVCGERRLATLACPVPT